MLTHDQAVRVGINLRSLIRSSDFQKVVEILQHQYTTQLMQTEWSAKEKREQLYQQHTALVDLLGTLETFVQIAEADALHRDETE